MPFAFLFFTSLSLRCGQIRFEDSDRSDGDGSLGLVLCPTKFGLEVKQHGNETERSCSALRDPGNC